jgi:hypothetical protein
MEVEVRIGLVVVADQAGAHFWLVWLRIGNSEDVTCGLQFFPRKVQHAMLRGNIGHMFFWVNADVRCRQTDICFFGC